MRLSVLVAPVNREIRQRRAFVIVHRSFVICHCPEITQCSLGIDRLLRLAMTNDK
jgi:elongation factor P--beta-lysine ligase